MKKVLLTAFVITLAGCSANEKTTALVQANDWAQIGSADVANGLIKKSEARLMKMNEKFAGSGADYQAYSNAYDEGLTIYCDIENAYVLGFSQQNYNGICDALPIGERFRDSWYKARYAGKDY